MQGDRVGRNSQARQEPPVKRAEDTAHREERRHESDATAPVDHVHSVLIVVDVD